ncbi:MAG: ABC transporter substrate-binding protein [Nocardioidaceae bacterium]|nr:MAG: ABC transporter substrate-binding protein [Nocardioidaceae bacterium]
MVLLALAILTGCGGDASGSDPGNVSGNTSGATRAVKDTDGVSITVPEHPERVVVLSEPTLDGALAVGVTPIGTVAGRGQGGVPNYIADLAADIPILGSVAQPNFEAIGKADPDLILVDGSSVNNNPDVLKALASIAPVVYTGLAGGDWRENFQLTADALNKSDEAAKILEEYDAEAARVRQELAPAWGDKTFAIVRWQGNAPSLILKELPAGVALTDMGLQRPPSQDRMGRGHSDPVSLENLATIDADHMFFGTLGGSSVNNPNAGGGTDVTEAQKALETAEKVPGFTDLVAYRNEGITLVDGSLWTSTGGPILMSRLVANVEEALNK